MALILNIETATKNCSVSLSENGTIIALKEFNEGSYTHAENLHLFIESIFQKTPHKLSQIDAVAVSKGPGSYTGLRIGVSAAKGICFALDKPLIGVDTLEILSTQLKIDNGLIIPMIDARRMEVYSAVYNHQHQLIRKTAAEIIHESSFHNYLDTAKVYFLGDGADKCQTIIKHQNAHFLTNTFPSAAEMGILSEKKYQQKQFEEVAYFEPFYLKDFITTPNC